MKQLFFVVASLLLCGAEKINWAMTERLDWKFEDKTVPPQPKKTNVEPAEKPPVAEKKVVTPYIIEYQYIPEIIYTQPRSVRYYRTTEYLCKPCK